MLSDREGTQTRGICRHRASMGHVAKVGNLGRGSEVHELFPIRRPTSYVDVYEISRCIKEIVSLPTRARSRSWYSWMSLEMLSWLHDFCRTAGQMNSVKHWNSIQNYSHSLGEDEVHSIPGGGLKQLAKRQGVADHQSTLGGITK